MDDYLTSAIYNRALEDSQFQPPVDQFGMTTQSDFSPVFQDPSPDMIDHKIMLNIQKFISQAFQQQQPTGIMNPGYINPSDLSLH